MRCSKTAATTTTKNTNQHLSPSACIVGNEQHHTHTTRPDLNTTTMDAFQDEKEAGKALIERKAGKQRIRRGSKFHRSYPDAGTVKPFAFWAGIEETLNHHRALLRNTGEGKMVVFYGEPGGGKTSAIKAIIHGNTGVKPERSLTVRFVDFLGISDEQALLNRMAEILHFQVEEGADALYADLAKFVVDAVIRDEKKGLSAFQDTLVPAFQKLGSSFLSMCGAKETWEDEEDPPRPLDIIGIPAAQTKGIQSGRTKPIVVFDDVNRNIHPDGPLANFFYAAAAYAQDNDVICYVITQNRLTAYRIWQKNGGNWIAPHRAVSNDVPRSDTLAEWASKHEKKLEKKEVEALDKKKIPRFFFSEEAFVFGKEDKKTLLWNAFSAPLELESQRQYLRDKIDEVVSNDASMPIDQLMVQLFELGYDRPDCFKPRVST